MQPISLQTITDDPLAGCLPIFQDPGSGTTALRSLLMRLRLYYNESISTAIGDQLIGESHLVGINRWEYIINECLHELRRCSKDYDERYETVLINSWSKELLKKIPEDAVLEFVIQLKRFRQERKR